MAVNVPLLVLASAVLRAHEVRVEFRPRAPLPRSEARLEELKHPRGGSVEDIVEFLELVVAGDLE